ncbi:MAG: hypothetical protein M3Z20_10930 [Chloroflexota bacterium]|nr:hypothetical protein [Chloroflexota bacterium]
MENSRFDQLTSELSQRIERRRLALGAGAGLAALFATGFPSVIEAGKNKKKKRKKRKKKKKKGMCTSAYGQKLRCKPDQCCDPGTSTIAACTEIGFPTCCASSGLAHPLGSTCCTSYYHGKEGICSTDFPVCCSSNVGAGCCSAAFPVCCDTRIIDACCPGDYPVCCSRYCCPAGDTCTPDGSCASLVGKAGLTAAPTPQRRRQPVGRLAATQAFAEPAG